MTYSPSNKLTKGGELRQFQIKRKNALISISTLVQILDIYVVILKFYKFVSLGVR